jgi:hypothetical protein
MRGGTWHRIASGFDELRFVLGPFLSRCGETAPTAVFQMTKHGCAHGTKPPANEFPDQRVRNRSHKMCDYSLEHVESRPAKVGDQLVSTVFSNSITRGFADVGNPQVAVCLAPGTELVFDRDVECDHALGFFPTKKMGENTARFRRINQDRPHEHHDALEFPSGRVVLLTRLVAGQRATVLQLPVVTAASEPKSDSEPVGQPSQSEELVSLP